MILNHGARLVGQTQKEVSNVEFDSSHRRAAMTESTDNRGAVGRPSRTAWAAYAACAWALVFAAVHLYWGLGGTAGLPPGLSLFDNTALFVIDLVAIPLCVIGALLALALVRTWGKRFPRWMLLSAAWGASALFVAHAVPTVIDVVVLALGQRTEELAPIERLSLFLYEPYWLLGGILFGVAAWHCMRGTQP